MTESTLSGMSEWAACHCCGLHYLAANMVSFEYHPDDALCVACVSWLYDRSRPIVRRLNPIWRLPVRIRAWRTPSSVGTSTNHRPPELGALCSASGLTGAPQVGAQRYETDSHVNLPPLIAQRAGRRQVTSCPATPPKAG